ncbi:MAG: JAB domain-containing protein, partial [Muribaculaceae bacterium]|nr:JAB domain-containing protein [Muribaculaceae bacterium]
KVGEKYIITSSQSIYDLMRAEIGNLSHEEIWAIYLGRRNDVILKKRISSGSATASIFDVKAIIKEALLLDAQGMALAHNHPSGNLMPSGSDDQITRKMKEATKLMDIRMVDHLIVTASGFYSYYDSGRL